MPDFYSVKLDVNQIKQEIHFWNQQTSYINALHSDSIPNYIAGRKSIVGRREEGRRQRRADHYQRRRGHARRSFSTITPTPTPPL